MVGRVGFKMGGSRWCQPLSDVHGIGGLMVSCLCGLGGLCARQGWTAMMMCNQMLCVRHGLVGAGLVHGQMLVG